jgi:hypothetical protein
MNAIPQRGGLATRCRPQPAFARDGTAWPAVPLAAPSISTITVSRPPRAANQRPQTAPQESRRLHPLPQRNVCDAQKNLDSRSNASKNCHTVFVRRALDAPTKGCIFSVAVLDHALPGLHRTAGVSNRHAHQAPLRSGRLHLRLRALRYAGHPHHLSQSNENRGRVSFPPRCGAGMPPLRQHTLHDTLS